MPCRYAINSAAGRVLLAVVSVALGAGTTSAQELPYSQTVLLGRPARPARITLTLESGAIKLQAGRDNAILPVPEADQISVESIEMARGARVAIVRVDAKSVKAAALLSRPRGAGPKILWTGRLDAHGDPGERQGDLIEVADRTGDGTPDVVVAQFHQGARICGQKRTVLYPRAVDPSSLALRPVLLNRLQSVKADEGVTIRATRENPGVNTPPVLNALRFVAASSHPGATGVAATMPVDTLTDGALSSSWIEGRGTGGRGEFVTGHWTASHLRLRAIAFVFSSDDPAKAQRLARPRTFWLVGGESQRLRVEVPEDPITHPGIRYWVVPDKPLSLKCLSIVLNESFMPGGDRHAHTAIAEVEAYTDLDFGDGIEGLVEKLAQDTGEAGQAAELLAAIGVRSVSPLVKAWKRMSTKGRRRAIRVFAAWAERSGEARNALVRAARQETGEARNEALRALSGAGEPGFRPLSDLITEPGELGDSAALATARSFPGQAVPVLLAAVSTAGGSEREGLRRALGLAAEKGGEPALAGLRQWSRQDRSPQAQASAALAVAHLADFHTEALDLVNKARTRTDSFETRWRLVQASGALPSDPEVDGWLEQLVSGEKLWMLRSAALTALQQRRASRLYEIAESALGDDYPRVRATALTILSGSEASTRLLARYAHKDSWPMVRAAAVEALTRAKGASPVIIRAVDDPSKSVRATAIRALAEREERSAWQTVEKRLLDRNEWPMVMKEAVAFARKLCIAQSAKTLRRVVDRGLQPNPWLPDVDLAARALEALTHIGAPEARSAISAASSPAAPALLQATAKRASGRTEGCKKVKN